jgi:Rrf2 family nitric oxide-sensitive transcriptional repressor
MSVGTTRPCTGVIEMEIVHQPGVTGDIDTMRETNGGVRHGKPAGDINLGGVVRRTEPDMDLVTCFEDAGICAISKARVLRSALNEAFAVFLAVLYRYTLAKLVTPRRKPAAVLGIARGPTHWQCG